MRRLALLSLLVLAACQPSTTPSPDLPASSSAARPAATPPTASGTPASSATLASSATASAEKTAAATMPDGAARLAKSNNAFALALYPKLGAGNVAVSPASIGVALAMTGSGAKGETAAQLRKVLHVDADPAETWGKMATALQDPSRPYELRIANRLFGEKSYAFEDAFVLRTKTLFQAPLEPLDFKTQKDASRARINGWVAEQTKQRIKDLVPEPAITKDTRLALVNAIYFLADWATPFEKTGTSSQDFSLAPGKTKKTETMHRGGHLRAGAAPGVRLVELPYKGGQTTMLVVVPEKVDGLADVEKKLGGEILETWERALTDRATSVSLPKFTLDPAKPFLLADALKELGMPLAFDRRQADFTGIANPPAPSERLFIGEVVHKAFVKVDEKGTEAAAATAVVMALGGAAAPEPPFEVKADRPFLFLIRDTATGLVLFMGRVADPKP